METNTLKFKVRLGLFVAGGLILFVAAIFVIGKQKSMFKPVFELSSTFYNVSGLQVGNNVRFSGINVGTVDEIRIIDDSTVLVMMILDKNVKQFIKTDSEVSIGSEGLIGDRILIISQGSYQAQLASEGQWLASVEPIETDAIIMSLEVTAGNAEIISQQLAEIMFKVNSGKGTLGMLIQDSTMAKNLDRTMINLENSSQGLEENMEAAKHNVFLKGYFNKKERVAARKKKEAEERRLKESKE